VKDGLERFPYQQADKRGDNGNPAPDSQEPLNFEEYGTKKQV
jgi:hypothetical protein